MKKLNFKLVILSMFAISHLLLGCKKSNNETVTNSSPTGFSVKVNNMEISTYGCRLSAVPFNQIWAGYQRPLNQTEIGAFAYWDMQDSQSSSIEIVAERAVHSVKVSPASSGIIPAVNGNKITFTITKPKPIVVEINGKQQALHLFPNPKEGNIPVEGTANLRYYGPGEHHVGRVKLMSNESVYIASGATVFGSFYAVNASNIKVYGRGILDSRKLERGMGSVLGFSGCSDITIEGIILRDPSMWCFTFFGCNNVNVINTKLIGLWRYNADGIDVVNSQNVNIKDCFIRSFDDALVVKGMKLNLGEPEQIAIGSQPVMNVSFTGCVVWCDWGHAMEIGAETSAPYMDGITFKDCDIISAAHCAMDVQHGDGAAISNVRYENIRFEIEDHVREPVTQQNRNEIYTDPNRGYMPSLMQLRIQKNIFSQDEFLGTLTNVLFKDISVISKNMPKSLFFGADNQHTVTGVIIDNLQFNGKKILNAQEAGLTIGDFVSGVEFK